MEERCFHAPEWQAGGQFGEGDLVGEEGKVSAEKVQKSPTDELIGAVDGYFQGKVKGGQVAKILEEVRVKGPDKEKFLGALDNVKTVTKLPGVKIINAFIFHFGKMEEGFAIFPDCTFRAGELAKWAQREWRTFKEGVERVPDLEKWPVSPTREEIMKYAWGSCIFPSMRGEYPLGFYRMVTSGEEEPVFELIIPRIFPLSKNNNHYEDFKLIGGNDGDPIMSLEISRDSKKAGETILYLLVFTKDGFPFLLMKKNNLEIVPIGTPGEAEKTLATQLFCGLPAFKRVCEKLDLWALPSLKDLVLNKMEGSFIEWGALANIRVRVLENMALALALGSKAEGFTSGEELKRSAAFYHRCHKFSF